MALKFRRGAAAQQSGSLIFGEPYINTDLNTLLIGGNGTQIQLLNISGGISSSLVPQTGSTFDLGSPTNPWRHLYIASASIRFIDGAGTQVASLSAQQVNALTSGTGSVSGIINATNGVVSGSSQITYTGISSIPSGIVSGSTQITPLLPAGIVSGSIQVLGSTGIISSSAQLSGTTITNLTITNLTTVNETASVIFSSGSNVFGDFGNDIHSFTGSVQISGSLSMVGASTATSYNGIHNGTINATNGVVSGSSQISYASISSIPAGIVSGSAQTIANLPTGVVSGSSQTIANLPTGVVSGSSQITGIGNTQLTNSSTTIGSTAIALGSSATTIAGLTSVTSTGFTGALTGNASTATTLQTARTINGTSFNGSADITIANLVSGSSQITYASISSIPGGIVSGSAQTIANLPTGTVSGSSQVTLSSTTGYSTTINQNLLTTSNVQYASLGIGMAASGTAGRIDASGDVVAYSTSDKNFKENIIPIQNALEKISKISGNTYDWKPELKEFHGFEGNDVGVIAQEIEEILPQLVTTRETGYKAVKYDKLVALLIEGIKEQQSQIHNLTLEVENLKKQKGL